MGPLQQPLVGQSIPCHRRHLQQQMEVIGHQTVAKNPTTREILLHPQLHPERLAFPRPKYEPPVHHSRDAVVNGRFRHRILSVQHPADEALGPLGGSGERAIDEVSGGSDDVRGREPIRPDAGWRWFSAACFGLAAGYNGRHVHQAPRPAGIVTGHAHPASG